MTEDSYNDGGKSRRTEIDEEEREDSFMWEHIIVGLYFFITLSASLCLEG